MKIQKLIDRFVCIGAAIVILGALFKLQHLPFAGWFLWVGLVTEAIIFLLYAIFPSSADTHSHYQSSSDKLIPHSDNKELIESMNSLNETYKKVYNLR